MHACNYAKEQNKLLPMNDAITSVAIALKAYSAGEAVSPIRTALPVKAGEGTALFMPSSVESESSLGIKFVSVFPKNKEIGKETIYGVMVLADVLTGEPLAILEASFLTVLRTGTASGLATKYLAKENASVLGVIGTGRQARGLIDAVLAISPITTIYLYNRNSQKAEQLAKEITSFSKKDVEVIVADSAKETVTDAEVLITATNSNEPVLSEDWVMEGPHINAIGSFRPSMQEIPTGLIKKASKVVVESREAALEETGDLLIPIQAGFFSSESIYAEMGELVANQKVGRQNENEITIFKSVGLATMDVVVAKEIYDRALSAGIGQQVSLFK
jgi:ornithine cyclodeaminase